MATIIQWRRDTAANWTTIDPVLANGEAGLETDTNKLKLGDGVTVWSLLPYWVGGPPSGQVNTVVGGTDITVDSSDPVNPIVNYTGEGAAQQDPPFAYKPAGEPIVLVLTGQSNAVGATTSPAQPFPPNANVFDWTTGGSGGVYSWQSPDLNDPQRADFNDTLVYTGMPLGGRGNIGWSAANRIQELTGRDVYVICVALNSEPIQGWYAGERMANELNLQVPAALAAVPGAPTGIDGFIWMQGEANLEIVSPANYLPPKEYSQAFLDLVYTQFVTEGWIIDRQTQVAICEIAWSWETYGNTMLRQIQYDGNEFFRVISSYGLPFAGDNIHYTPYALAQLGDISANGMMAGPDPRLKNPEAYLEDIWNVDVADVEQNQILYYDAVTETWKPKTSTSALGIIEFDYRWSTAPNATPASGFVSSNNADPALATIIYVNELSTPGNDLSLFFESLDANDWLNINAPSAAETRNAYDVIGDPIKVGDVYQIPVSPFDITPYLPGNNNQVALFLRYQEVDDGLPPGGTDGQMLFKSGTDDYIADWEDPPFSVQSVVAGTNVTVDNTDPANPIVSAVGGGGSGYWAPGTDPNDIVNTNSGQVGIGGQPLANRKLTVSYESNAPVQVIGLGTATAARVAYSDPATTQSPSAGSSGNDFQVVAGGLIRTTILADSGNMGIGIEDPLANLHILSRARIAANNVQAGLQMVRVTTPDITGILLDDELSRIDMRGGFDATTETAARISALAAANWTSLSNPGTTVFYNTPVDQTVPVETMRISSEGNVGIGVDDPTAPLHVVDDGEGTVPIQMIIDDSGDFGTRIRFRSAGLSIATITAFGINGNAPGSIEINTVNNSSPQGLFSGDGVTQSASKFEVVTALPGTPDDNTIYFVTG